MVEENNEDLVASAVSSGSGSLASGNPLNINTNDDSIMRSGGGSDNIRSGSLEKAWEADLVSPMLKGDKNIAQNRKLANLIPLQPKNEPINKKTHTLAQEARRKKIAHFI